MCPWPFLTVSWGGADGVLLCEWIFLHLMVGGGRGVAGPKELMGLVGAVTDRRAYSPPAPRFVEVEAIQTQNSKNSNVSEQPSRRARNLQSVSGNLTLWFY